MGSPTTVTPSKMNTELFVFDDGSAFVTTDKRHVVVIPDHHIPVFKWFVALFFGTTDTVKYGFTGFVVRKTLGAGVRCHDCIRGLPIKTTPSKSVCGFLLPLC